MKYLILFLISLLLPISIFAQEIEKGKVNARILPTIWFSTLDLKEGESVKIYAGIQNNSGVDFSGTAVFNVDDKEISRSTFNSSSETLKTISASWKTISGTHDIQVKISTNLSGNKTLVEYDTNVSTISIDKNITKDYVKDKIIDTADKVVLKTDSITENLVSKIDKYKKPVEDKLDITGTVKNLKNSVFGTSTGKVIDSDKSIGNFFSNAFDSAWNIVIDTFKFLISHWKWSLGGVLLLYLIYKIFL
ncbi:MAG: hypothetical protein AAB683_00695 [Patescibacteria group bacterium]